MGLTEKQKNFAFQYAKDWNATKAAARAGYSEATSGAAGSALLQKVEILEEIEMWKDINSVKARLTPEWVLYQWKLIAEADPADLVRVEILPCKKCWPGIPGAGLPPNPECKKCSGAGENLEVAITPTRLLTGAARRLYAGAKQTKDGIEIKMRDQDAALKSLANYLGMEKNDQRIMAVVDTLTKPARQMTEEELTQFIASQTNLALPEPDGGNNGGTPAPPPS